MPDTDRVERKHRRSLEERQTQEQELEDQEHRVNRIRVLYDQYFMGIEKLEPFALRSLIEKTFLRSTIPQRGTTAMKFRFRSLQQKFSSYSSYWDRLVRLIEEGRIRRGVKGQSGLPASVERSSGLKDSLASKRTRFFRKREENLQSEFSAGNVEALHRALIRRKQEAGEDTSQLTLELLRERIRQIQERAGNRKLTLLVSNAEDGSVHLSARIEKQKPSSPTE